MIVARITSRSPASRAVVAVLALAAAGCGVNADDYYTRTSPVTATSVSSQMKALRRQQAAHAAVVQAALAQVPAGSVRIDDSSNLGVLPVLDAGFATGSSDVATPVTVSPAKAFQDLCDGQTDIAMATSLPTATEVAACAANGITLPTTPNGQAQPIQLAADAIVIATRNEDSVGGDCLRRTTVRHIFAAGSTIDNWSQVGFDDRQLVTTGREANNDTYQLFANLVLGASGTASLDEARSDLVVHPTDLEVLDQVEFGSRRVALTRAVDAALAKAKRRIRLAEAAAGTQANARVLAEIAQENAARAKTRKVLTPAQKAAIARANAIRDAAAKRAAEAAAGTKVIRAITASVTAGRDAALGSIGDVGYFRFTYYELYEDKLRPMEIWDPVQEAASLAASGVATTAGVAQPTEQAVDADVGGSLSIGRIVEVPSTPTAPGSHYVTASGQRLTVPQGGPVNVNTTPDCVFPSAQTVESGVYPLSVRMFAFTSKLGLARPAVRDYLAYVLSTTGQNLVSAQRLVPLDLQTENLEYEQVTGRPLPGRGIATPASTPATTTPAGTATSTTPTPTNEGTVTLPAVPANRITGVDASQPTTTTGSGR
jgi:phosphate transport system substrate-binding protein